MEAWSYRIRSKFDYERRKIIKHELYSYADNSICIYYLTTILFPVKFRKILKSFDHFKPLVLQKIWFHKVNY